VSRKKFNQDRDVGEWKGKYAPYDIIKEGTIALLVVGILVLGLAVFFGSPDEHAITIKQWSTQSTQDFIATAATELDGSSFIANYGPPYTNTPNAAQKIGPIALPEITGVRIPINTAEDFVLNPLRSLPGQPALHQALNTYATASAKQQQAWSTAYANNAATTNSDGSITYNVKYVNGQVVMPPGNYGPVSTIMQYETEMARSGALDQALITGGDFYTTNYTKPSLFLADGQYLANVGAAGNLGGEQWGMMNETGAFPGQAWLWLYTLLYQIPPYSTSWAANADAMVWFTMIILTGILMFLPFIPGLRSIPRWTRVYKLIWRDHYRQA
jgi:hypothetical protein